MMAIITISRNSYSKAEEVAERLSKKLNYRCISRDILVEAASRQYNLPEVILARALRASSSILDSLTLGKEKYITYIRAAFLKRVKNGNVVYHGIAGHFFLQEISHILKVRIFADMETRIKEKLKYENISSAKARNSLIKDDVERRKWSLRLYGIDTYDTGLYGLVIQIGKTLDVDNAVDIIYNTVRLPGFQPTSESQKNLDDITLAAQVEAEAIRISPFLKVTADSGTVYIDVKDIKGPYSNEKVLSARIEKAVEKIEEVKDIKIYVSAVG